MILHIIFPLKHGLLIKSTSKKKKLILLKQVLPSPKANRWTGRLLNSLGKPFPADIGWLREGMYP